MIDHFIIHFTENYAELYVITPNKEDEDHPRNDMYIGNITVNNDTWSLSVCAHAYNTMSIWRDNAHITITPTSDNTATTTVLTVPTNTEPIADDTTEITVLTAPTKNELINSINLILNNENIA